MNSLWLSNLEILNEERQADFRREMEVLRLEREARMVTRRPPTWARRLNQALSAWMIRTGKRLNQRLQQPAPVPRWYQSFKVAR